MKLPSFRRLFLGDFNPEEQPLVSKLATTINQGFEFLYDVLNKKVSLADNIYATIKDIVVQVDATGSPINTTTFQIETTGVINGCLVIKAENLTNTSIYPSSGIFISYTQTQTGVRIDRVTGLQVGNQYRLRIVAFG